MRHWRWILPLAVAGCTGGASTQVLEGRLSGSGAQVVRAVSGSDVIAAAQVKGDGTFSIALPAGATYRLEVLTASGVKSVVARDGSGAKALSFKVCVPQDPFDVGGVGDTGTGCGNGGGDPPPACDPSTDPNCKCDPNGNCYPPPPPPPPCDPATDPNCVCDANGNCYPPPPPPPPKCDPNTDPSCTCDAAGNCQPPPPCDPSTDPNCVPPPPPPGCDPTTDPNCKCDPNGDCYPPPPDCDPSTGVNCPPACPDPDADGNCPPPCTDPNDPSTCKDPCMIDPMSCGCADGDPNCWPGPQPPPCDDKGACDPDGTMAPDHAPGDFGCEGG